MNNNTSQYMNPLERKVVARLSYEKADVVSKKQFEKMFGFPKNVTTKTLFRLKQKGILTSIKKGVYIFSPLDSGAEGRRINEFLIPQILFPKGNYYIGYSTMYSYWSFTEQIFQTIYILNTSLQREKTIGETRFNMIKISNIKLYGLKNIRIQNTNVKVSDKERTLIDMFYFSQPVGGIKTVFEITKNMTEIMEIDIKKLIKYAVKFPNLTLKKRVGFILDKAGINDELLEPLIEKIQNTSLVALYPSNSRCGPINKKWKVIENAA